MPFWSWLNLSFVLKEDNGTTKKTGGKESNNQRKLLNLWTDFVVKEQPKPFEPVADR